MLTAVLDIFKAVAVHLLRQIVHHLDQTLVSGCLQDDVVKGHVGLSDSLGIPAGHALFKLAAGILQGGEPLLGDPVAGKFRTERIQRPPDFQYVAHALLGDLGHFCAPPRNHGHQPFQLQLADGLPYGRAAHSQLIRQMDFHKAFSGL